MLIWDRDRSGYWLGRTRTGAEVAEISPCRMREPIIWKVFGAKSGTAATVQFAQRQAEEVWLAQHEGR